MSIPSSISRTHFALQIQNKSTRCWAIPRSRAEQATWQAVHLVQLSRLSSSCQSWAAVNRVYSMCVCVCWVSVCLEIHIIPRPTASDIESRYNWFKIPVLPCTSGHHRSLIFYLRFLLVVEVAALVDSSKTCDCEKLNRFANQLYREIVLL